ncbi:putative PurR-regulated permease PerM [Motilibacter rhizosphaerae]|uniref:Putative PurR-regulated permease PerM n=1 Tax=Motilibacter rhizosphaerae TaxID=598652 RepID=A0A4Q7NPM1_9ACTN|nr:AI-2E family transporter [Motilibacter rhizosphaerae]RZS87231.1 putative PurR-regulated permease PerM [Motilibacter rhizosphaerae]
MSLDQPRYAAPERRDRVPVRTIAATIGMVLLTVLALLVVQRIARTLVWLAIALFFAVALSPLVDLVQNRLRLKRSLATLLVYVVGLLLLAGLVTAFVTPLVNQVGQLSNEIPKYVQDAQTGHGPFGSLLKRYDVDQYITKNQDKIRSALAGAGVPALHYVAVAGEAVIALVTITVLSFLMVLEGPKLTEAAVAQLPDDRQTRVRRVAHDCARTVTGYITGALLIAVICGVLTFAVLYFTGVPFAGVVALFVAVCDLIPLVGATLGAVVAVVVALFAGVQEAIIVAVWFVIYQQLENHLFQPVVQSRTVKLNPLAVLVSVLVGVELAGILGALVAIPVAGIIQVIIRDVYDVRRGQPKQQPTVGEERRPVG